jgi:BirA family biotin operon repressor/biotin-[acetyl-CoA-carboxylase] ligase
LYNNLPKTLFIGRSVVYLPTCHSTNDIAASLIGKPQIFEGTVVVTSNQTAGKGQRGNTWESEPFKNLTFSLILHPNFLKVSQQFNLNIVISLAVYDLLTIYLGEKVKIKWPNDIYVIDHGFQKKICGILIQNFIKKDSLEHSVAGVGINVNQVTFGEAKATSLNLISGQQFDLEELLRIFMEKAEKRYLLLKNEEIEPLKSEYFRVLLGFNQTRKFKSGKGEFEGKIIGIDDIGRLMIESDQEISKFSFKEVEFLNF